ncbi:hypothetical protein B296_00051310 [Ensete ventricosum]|uniref:DUF7050 domain-containing protein n=1 Tax=Ensete ventricosum TaxID=4639 RepID=A0A426Y8W0_ENSVE|nr:hypothetical protein B296_00051310 [Ensete ventricosum]
MAAKSRSLKVQVSTTLPHPWTPSSSSAPTPAVASSEPPVACWDARTSASGPLFTIRHPSTYTSSSPFTSSFCILDSCSLPWDLISRPSSSYLTSTVGWHRGDDSTHPSSSSGSPSRGLFDAYRRSFCDIQHSCVPGLAYKNSLPYFELGDADLMDLASMRVQRQFYQV